MTIHIEDLKFQCIIGILDFERKIPQDVEVNLTIEYNYKDEFINIIFEQLCEELLRLNIDERIDPIGEYWDNEVQIPILAKTRSKKTIACSCKFTNAKIKKSEFTKLQANCEKANIQADAFVMFSKKGFSSELKSLKGDNLQLFTIKNFKQLLQRER